MSKTAFSVLTLVPQPHFRRCSKQKSTKKFAKMLTKLSGNSSTIKNATRLIQCRLFCTVEPPRKKLSEKVEMELEEGKKNLQWRTPPSENPKEWYSKFRLFDGVGAEQNSDLITFLQQPIDLSPSSIKSWMERRQVKRERYMQQYVRERHQILGSNLAAAHFVTYRGGRVKFVDMKEWYKSDEDMPNKHDPNYLVEAIRCDNMELYYEGLENIRRLEHMKFLSFHNVKTFDDWCLDRVSGSEHTALEVLDISGTNITERGLSCLYRIPTLKLLIVDDPKISKAFELSCSLLEECIPKLKIVPASDIHS